MTNSMMCGTCIQAMPKAPHTRPLRAGDAQIHLGTKQLVYRKDPLVCGLVDQSCPGAALLRTPFKVCFNSLKDQSCAIAHQVHALQHFELPKSPGRPNALAGHFWRQVYDPRHAQNGWQL